MFTKEVEGESPKLTHKDIQKLVSQTENYSGAGIILRLQIAGYFYGVQLPTQARYLPPLYRFDRNKI